MSQTKWMILGRGFAGWNTKGITKYSPDHEGYATSGSGGTFEGYLKDCQDDCVVYDASHLENDPVTCSAFVEFVVKGPMADLTLPPGSIKITHWQKLMVTDTIEVVGNRKLSSLDYVSVDVWLAKMIEMCPSVKVGKVYAGVVMWNK